MNTRSTAGMNGAVHAVWYDLVSLELRLRDLAGTDDAATARAPSGLPVGLAAAAAGVAPGAQVSREDDEWLIAYT